MVSITQIILSGQWTAASVPKTLPLLGIILVVFVVYHLFLVVYRLIFHPLAGFPGPRWAAVSTWWLYLEQRGHHIEPKLKKLHKEYNTRVLRIGPNELHLDDVSVYDQIYSMKEHFLKYDYYYAGFNAPSTVFSESSPVRHRERRKLISSFFSKQGVAAVQHLLDAKVDMTIEKISSYHSYGPIYLYKAIRCMTADIISEYAFGEPFGLIQQVEDNKFDLPFLGAFDLLLHALADFTYLPLLRGILNILPNSLVVRLDKNVGQMTEIYNSIDRARTKFKNAHQSGVKFARPPIFEPLSGLSDHLMISEGIDIIIAGSDTTAMTLANLFNCVLTNPNIEKKLVAELDAAIPDRKACPKLVDLERLDYLSACIKEALRVSMAVPGRLPRVVPKLESGAPPLTMDGKLIPPGSIVGMSATTMHSSEELWGPDAENFRPERWLQPNAKQLDKYLVTFSKGARQCLGINLAYAELRIATAKLFRRFTFSLDPTMTEKDIHQLDCFTTTFEGTGVRFNVKCERE